MKTQRILPLSLTIICCILITGCQKKTAREYVEEAGLTFHDEQKACSVCGETLEPGSFGKEGCYRESTGEYLTMEEYVRYHFSSPVDPHIPLPPKHESCPDCNAVLEPGTFGKEGCYRTKSGYYLTKEQYYRLSISCDIASVDMDGKTGYALILYDNPDSCGEDYIIPTCLHKDDYVHTEPLSEKITEENIKDIAEDERIHQNQLCPVYTEGVSQGKDCFAFYKLYQLYYDKQTDMWLADYYSPGNEGKGVPYDYFQVYIDGTGVTREIYHMEPNQADPYMTFEDSATKKTPVNEIGTFSYADVHKTTGFVHKAESADVPNETLAAYAEEELRNSAFASYLDETPIIKLAYTNEENTAFRVSFYWTNKPFQVVHVYITKQGETTDMYVHER